MGLCKGLWRLREGPERKLHRKETTKTGRNGRVSREETAEVLAAEKPGDLQQKEKDCLSTVVDG